MLNKITLVIASIALILGIVALVSPKSINLGGTTADDWNVGGNLAVTGTGSVTGALTQTGAATLSSTLTVSGETNLDTLIQGGDLTTFTASTTGADGNIEPTAAQLCDSAIWKIALLDDGDTRATIQLPTSTDIIADCLLATGDSKKVKVWNANASSSLDVVFTQRNLESTFLDFMVASSTDQGVEGTSTSFPTLRRDQHMWLIFQNTTGVTTTVEGFLMQSIVP